MKPREPLSDEQLIAAGRAMWERYGGVRELYVVPMGAIILMAYAEPAWAWRVHS